MKLFDAHCHLQAAPLFQQEGPRVEKVVCCATRWDDVSAVLECAHQCRQVIPMVGIHPWFVSANWEAHVQAIARRIRSSSTWIGLGEMGLDFQARFTNRSQQVACFSAQIELAAALNRPVAIHCVRAWGALLEILRRSPRVPKILHAFSGAAELIPELVDLNSWFSFGGHVVRERAKRARAAARAVPIERLLIETDAPDGLLPGTDWTTHLIDVARAVADLRGLPTAEIARQSAQNARAFFAA